MSFKSKFPGDVCKTPVEQLRNCLQNGRVDRNALIKGYNLLKLEEVRKVCPSEYTATSNKQRPDQHMKF